MMHRAAVFALVALISSNAAGQTSSVCSADPATLFCGPSPRFGPGGSLAEGFHAWFSRPTGRYDHAILGDAEEWGGLVFLHRGPADGGPDAIEEVLLPVSRVFEDLAPRMADLDADGVPEIIVVETDLRFGASLAIYGLTAGGLTKRAATPPIGEPHRWLAPIGVADLDGDGRLEIAYVDRPHLARILRVWRFEKGRLTEIASAPGHTNHRIGEREILGGMRTCGEVPEIVTASPDWTTLLATRYADGRLISRAIGVNSGPAAIAAALGCR